MSYLLRTAESHPEGYHGMYAAPELKKGIIQFLNADQEATGRTQHATRDIILGLKTLFGIEFDLHSVEYVMRHMMTSEGSKQVGTEPISSVVKKCEDGRKREFVCSPPPVPRPARARHSILKCSCVECWETRNRQKSEAAKPNIPKNLTEDELYKLFQDLTNKYAWAGATYNPRTFPEFKESSGY